MAPANGSKATIQQVYDLVLGLETKIETKIDKRLGAFEEETRRVVGGHSVELAVIGEKQQANIVRMDGIEARATDLQADLEAHGEILNGRPPETPGLVGDMQAVKRTAGWAGKLTMSLALAVILGAGGVLWALLTHKIVLVEAAQILTK